MSYARVIVDSHAPKDVSWRILIGGVLDITHYDDATAYDTAAMLNKAYTAGVLKTREEDNEMALSGMRAMLALIREGKADVVAEAYKTVIDSQEKQNG